MYDVNKRFRHELKYLISPGEKALICERLRELLITDEHALNGQYKIRSLYFDDFWDSAYEEKIMGVYNRKKYRIRLYNDSPNFISLEKKLKRGNYIRKTSARITENQTSDILNGNYSFLLESENNLLKEFYYQLVSCYLRPRVIVDYEREPYVMAAGDVRITFDSNVRAAVLSHDLFDPELPAINALEENKIIMEVKFTEFIPRLLKSVLPPRSSELAAVSKYIICCDKTSYLNASSL